MLLVLAEFNLPIWSKPNKGGIHWWQAQEGQVVAYGTEASENPKSAGTYDKLRVEVDFIYLQHRKVFQLELDLWDSSHHQRIIFKEKSFSSLYIEWGK